MQASLIKRANGELLRHATVTKIGDLRKEEPDPVAGLSPGAEFSEDCVIYALLGVKETVGVVDIGHELCHEAFSCSLKPPCAAKGFSHLLIQE